MYETFESLPKSTHEKYGMKWDGKEKREITTYWSLAGGGEQPETRLYLTTHHDPDSKVFRSTLSWDTKEPAEPGSPFSVSMWGSDHHMMAVQYVPVARYSKKVIESEHARALRMVEGCYQSAGFYLVAQQAAEKSGLVSA